jgi:hypothetical protein
MIVDALGVAAVGFTARLPTTLEDVARIEKRT